MFKLSLEVTLMLIVRSSKGRSIVLKVLSEVLKMQNRSYYISNIVRYFLCYITIAVKSAKVDSLTKIRNLF